MKTKLLKHLKTCIQGGSSNLFHFPLPSQQSFLGLGGSGRFWQWDLTTFFKDDLGWEFRQPLIQRALIHQAVHGCGGQWRLLLILTQSRNQGVTCPVQFLVYLLPGHTLCLRLSWRDVCGVKICWQGFLEQRQKFLSRDLGVALKIRLEVRVDAWGRGQLQGRRVGAF